jgi:membrane protein implicated in regulation of membrane protease activity
MTQRDQNSAKELTFVYLGVWAAGGTLLAAALAGGTPEVQLAGVATCGLIAAVIGWSVSQSRRASLRPQSIRTRRKIDTQ